MTVDMFLVVSKDDLFLVVSKDVIDRVERVIFEIERLEYPVVIIGGCCGIQHI